MNSQAHKQKQKNDHQHAYQDSQKNTRRSLFFHIANNLLHFLSLVGTQLTF